MKRIPGVLITLCVLLWPLKLDPETRERCISVLDEGMRGTDFWPSMHAAEALTLAGQQKAVREFLEPKLKVERDDQKRCGLARELVRAGNFEQTSVIMGILSGADPHGHVHAAESLYKVGWSGDSAPLQKALGAENDIRLRIMAAAALAKHGQGTLRAESFAFLRQNLRDEKDAAIFRLSAWVLGRIGEDQDRGLIRSRLDDARHDPVVHAFLENALAALGDPQARQALLENLTSSDPAIRTYAAVIAGESGILQAAPILIRQLDDQNLDARIRAAQALLLLAQ